VSAIDDFKAEPGAPRGCYRPEDPARLRSSLQAARTEHVAAIMTVTVGAALSQLSIILAESITSRARGRCISSKR
jgi:hypothetical protein